MTARGAAGRCPSSTWLGSRLLLVSLPGYWVNNLSGHESGRRVVCKLHQPCPETAGGKDTGDFLVGLT
ncbi:colony stimulating factor 1 (macrophage), isoform CRA_c [Mus musculus]|nr:colony stimulating factor 1 (macrophage), isoform CRA_c [Mus musculus]